MGKRNPNRPAYYLDACVLIELIERPRTDQLSKIITGVLMEAEEGQIDLITSTLTIAEVWKAKSEADSKAISPEAEKKINSLWHPDSSPIQIVEVSELIAREALSLLRSQIVNGWFKTKGNDAIHLVTARREGVDEFFSIGERAMKKWEEILGFKVCAPHTQPTPEELSGQQSMFGGNIPESPQ